MDTIAVPAATRKAFAVPESYDIGYKISCRRCGDVDYERVAQPSEFLERRCRTGCGAIVRIAGYLLSPAFTPPHQQEFDLALLQSKVEQKEAALASNRRLKVRRKTRLDRTGS
ncbi:MAG TPA: hypothetical protein VK714_20660 [Myxococcota bacterium]|nr:hypothetical protein [Myxococcota bacterium]